MSGCPTLLLLEVLLSAIVLIICESRRAVVFYFAVAEQSAVRFAVGTASLIHTRRKVTKVPF